MRYSIVTALLLAHLCCFTGLAQEADDEAAVRKAGEAYVKAFNDADAEALASFWSPEAVYTNRLTGERVTGRAAIAKQFADLFKSEAKLKLAVAVESIEFVSPNVALEKGVATFAADEPERIPYSAVYIKREGKWLLDRVTDSPQPSAPSRYEQLKSIEWLIGSWEDSGDNGVTVRTDCNWTKNKSFITRTFAVSINGETDLSGMQIIGWDAREKRIRSWTFDSDGGTSQAAWSNTGNEWYIVKKGTTADGKSVSAVNVVTKVDNDSFKLRSVQRSLEGRLLQDIDEVVVVRK